MPQPLPIHLPAAEGRHLSPVASPVARLVGSGAWPFLVLSAVALLLFSLPQVVIHGVPVPELLVASVLISLVTWLVVDWLWTRVGGGGAVWPVVVVAVVIATAGAFMAARDRGISPLDSEYLAVLGGVAVIGGAWARWAFGPRRLVAQVLAMLALASSAADLDASILVQPWRDARLYIAAGRAFISHAPVYLTAPMTRVPHDEATLPFLYPPFTLPFFGALARLPHGLGVYVLVALCAVSVVAGLRLLGVSWRVLPLLLVWPPFAIGVQVGNVACIGFLLLAATYRIGFASPLTGIFKAQSGVVSLWLIRERRWTSLFLGIALVAGLIVATLPLTGIAIYGAWLHGLEFFQASLGRFPRLTGLGLQRYLPAFVAIGLAIVAIIVGMLARGRDGLARLGVAAVVASPTVYIHGLAFGLPAILMLDAATAWALMAVAPWDMGGWWAMALPVVALVVGLSRRQLAMAMPRAVTTVGDGDTATIDTDPFDADVHPLGSLLEPWPGRAVDRRRAGGLVERRAVGLERRRFGAPPLPPGAE